MAVKWAVILPLGTCRKAVVKRRRLSGWSLGTSAFQWLVWVSLCTFPRLSSPLWPAELAASYSQPSFRSDAAVQKVEICKQKAEQASLLPFSCSDGLCRTTPAFRSYVLLCSTSRSPAPEPWQQWGTLFFSGARLHWLLCPKLQDCLS